MLEICFAKAQQAFVKASVGGLRRLRVFPPGIWIGIVVILLFGGRWIWSEAIRPAHRQEIAAAFGAILKIYGVPQMNRDGSRFTYVATSDHGVAVFLCDANTGHKETVFEAVNEGDSTPAEYNLQVWAWSPDDRFFTYSMKDDLIICATATGKPCGRLAIRKNALSDVKWINPDEFAYLEGISLHLVQRQPGGLWKSQELSQVGDIASLTATDSNSIAWLKNNLICRVSLPANIDDATNAFAGEAPQGASAPPPANGLVLWLDAATLRQSDQSPVTFLADRSSRGNNAIASGAAPLYNAPGSPGALNGKGTIHFTTTQTDPEIGATGLKTQATLGIAGSMPRTTFAVMRRGTHGDQKMVVGIGEAGVTGASFSLCDSADFLYLPASWWIADNKIPSLVADWHLLEAAYTGAAQQGYVGGVLKTTKDYPLNTSDKEVVIGLVGANRDQNYALESNGDFAELLIYNRELSVSEREQVEAYLHEKWFGTKLLSAQSPLVWHEPGMNNLTGFSYSKATGQFLLSQSENGQVSLWRYDPQAAQPDRLTRLVNTNALYGAQWIGANCYAYGSRQPKQGGIVLAGPPPQENTRLFKGGNIDWFDVSPNGAKLLILGTVSNEPAAGIWQYDLASGWLQAAVAGSSHPSPYAETLRPFHGQFRLRSDRTVDCIIYPPSHFDRRKKYPLVLGNTFFGDELYRFQGPLWAPALASCGAYVVIINRGTWWGDIERWQENVMGVYHALADDPCIDIRQVYLFAASAETAYLDECATKNPGLWKGLILLNPGDLPDFSKSPMFAARPKILISAGSEEHEEGRLKEYQAGALSYGVLVDYIIHPGEPHHLVGNAAQLERTQAMMHFVFEE